MNFKKRPKTLNTKGLCKIMFCAMDDGHMGGVVVPPCFFPQISIPLKLKYGLRPNPQAVSA